MNELLLALNVPHVKPILRCEVFEDNKSTIALAKAPSMLPRTKHIGLKYHHFRQFVLSSSIDIEYASTEEQVGGIFTKSLPPASFAYLRHKLMGWQSFIYHFPCMHISHSCCLCLSIPRFGPRGSERCSIHLAYYAYHHN